MLYWTGLTKNDLWTTNIGDRNISVDVGRVYGDQWINLNCTQLSFAKIILIDIRNTSKLHVKWINAGITIGL